MDPFAAILFGGVAVFVLWVVALGRYVPGNGLEQLGLRTGAQISEQREALEAEDLAQMVAAHNRRRAARGEPAVSCEQVEMRVLSENAEHLRRGRGRPRADAPDGGAAPGQLGAAPGQLGAAPAHARAGDSHAARDAALAERELEQLLAATNARRRARGLPERTREQARREFGER